MRAASTAWTVAGTWIGLGVSVNRYAARSPTNAFVSTSVRMLSSRKKGFPPVRAMRVVLSGSSAASPPSSAPRSWAALSGDSVCRRTWS